MEKIIVTVLDTASQYAIDLEIPVNQNMETLKYDMVDAINAYDFSLQINPDRVDVYCERIDKKLYPGDTFESVGIWNGDYIILQRR